MNTIPDRIFLQWFGDETNPDPNDNVLVSEVSWNLERVFDADIEYNRANQLPAVQAQLDEAVELLEATRDYLLSNVPKGGVRKAFHELNAHACRVKAIHAFLDKVKA